MFKMSITLLNAKITIYTSKIFERDMFEFHNINSMLHISPQKENHSSLSQAIEPAKQQCILVKSGTFRERHIMKEIYILSQFIFPQTQNHE